MIINTKVLTALFLILVSSCNNSNCEGRFIQDFYNIKKAKEIIYANSEILLKNELTSETGFCAIIFFDEKDKRIYSSVKESSNKLVQCELTVRNELFIQCEIDEGLIVSEVYSYAYLPADSISTETKNRFNVKAVEKLSKPNWYLVMRVSGVD